MSQESQELPTDEEMHRRVRVVPLTDELLEEGIFRGNVRIVKGLPDDAEFVRLIEDPARMSYNLLYRSEEFSPVEEGERIPDFRIEFEFVG